MSQLILTTDFFEMAVAPGQYRSVPAKLVGSFAIHKGKNYWCISHAATGLLIPTIYPETKREAITAAKAMEAAADWSKITRTDDPGAPHIGLSKDTFRAAILAGEEAMIVQTHGGVA